MTTIEKYMYGRTRFFADVDFEPDIIMRLLYEITGTSYKHEGEMFFINMLWTLYQAVTNAVISKDTL